MWPQYLGEYQPTEEDHNGAQVYVNSEGLLLYMNDNGDWSANTVINNRGVLRGANSDNASVACLDAVTEWKYWDEKYKKWDSGDISTTCGEHGTLFTRYRVSHQKSDFTLFFAISLGKVYPKCKSWGSFDEFRKFAT